MSNKTKYFATPVLFDEKNIKMGDVYKDSENPDEILSIHGFVSEELHRHLGYYKRGSIIAERANPTVGENEFIVINPKEKNYVRWVLVTPVGVDDKTIINEREIVSFEHYEYLVKNKFLDLMKHMKEYNFIFDPENERNRYTYESSLVILKTHYNILSAYEHYKLHPYHVRLAVKYIGVEKLFDDPDQHPEKKILAFINEHMSLLTKVIDLAESQSDLRVVE